MKKAKAEYMKEAIEKMKSDEDPETRKMAVEFLDEYGENGRSQVTSIGSSTSS